MTEPTYNLAEMTSEQVDELLEQYYYHKAQVAAIEAGLKENHALTVETDVWRVNVASAARFDAASFERDYPVEEYPDLYIPQPPKVDAKKVDDETKASYSKPTAPRLTIKDLTK